MNAMDKRTPPPSKITGSVSVELLDEDGHWLAAHVLAASHGQERLDWLIAESCAFFGELASRGCCLKIWSGLDDPRFGSSELIAQIKLGMPELLANMIAHEGAGGPRSDRRLAYALERGAMALMPDYGGAALWLASGSNTGFSEEDWRPEIGEQDRLLFVQSIDAWQLQFEARSFNEPCLMNWRSFNSKGDALALRSRALLRHPLRHRLCHESPCDLESRQGGQEWASFGGLVDEANQALEAFDEGGFIRALKAGARQTPSEQGMSWAVYCCHFGLAAALAELDALGEGLLTAPSGRSSTALMAAILCSDPDCLRLASREGDIHPALADDLFNGAILGEASARSVGLCAEILWSCGCDPFPAWRRVSEFLRRGRPKVEALFAEMERFELSASDRKQPAKAGCSRL